jgi:hypothetical protein
MLFENVAVVTVGTVQSKLRVDVLDSLHFVLILVNVVRKGRHFPSPCKVGREFWLIIMYAYIWFLLKYYQIYVFFFNIYLRYE